MSKPYQEWRRASYSEAIAFRELQAQSRTRLLIGSLAVIAGVAGQFGSDDPNVQTAGWLGVVSGAMTLKSGLDKRQEAQIHAEVLQELGESAEAEISPHAIELENQTISLTGTVEAQYTELRRILRQAYYEELGLVVPPAPTVPASAETALPHAEANPGA